MAEFTVLDAANPGERLRWLQLWADSPDREVNAHPAYAELFAKTEDRVVCATLAGDEGVVLFPLIVRPLAVLPWAKDFSAYCDLVSPYGYGGPYYYGHPNAADFWQGFDRWVQEIHAVSCFARLSLFPEQQLAFAGEIEPALQNIVRSLTPDVDVLWHDYEYKVRKNVNRAQRSGLTVVVDPTGERLGSFLDVYYATMQRREASTSFYFPEAFFASIIEQLAGSFMFFHCLAGEQIVSTELVLASVSTVYSFLGGTLPEAFELRPNDLLKHEITLWAKATGRRHFVLGGGYGTEDGIFRYKRSFAPQGIVPFFVGKRIEEPHIYQQLIDARNATVLPSEAAWPANPRYFPLYRA